MKKFWNWTNQTDKQKNRTLFLNGTIADESWFDDDVTPQLFKSDLYSDTGDVTVWINSPGGDCVAAAQIYNMLREYPGNVTIKVDGIAASAASLISMAGDTVLMSPVSMMMIHNPLTLAAGNADDFEKVVEMLNEVKESILNAYELKTGLSRSKLSHMMDNETWMNATKAVELGFADGILYRNEDEDEEDDDDNGDDSSTKTEQGDGNEDGTEPETEQGDDNDDDSEKDKNLSNTKTPQAYMFSRQKATVDLLEKLKKHCENINPTQPQQKPEGRSVDALMDRLNLLKY